MSMKGTLYIELYDPNTNTFLPKRRLGGVDKFEFKQNVKTERQISRENDATNGNVKKQYNQREPTAFSFKLLETTRRELALGLMGIIIDISGLGGTLTNTPIVAVQDGYVPVGKINLKSGTVSVKSALSGACDFADAGDLVELIDHGAVDGQQLKFSSISTTTGITANTYYYIVNATTDTFQLSATKGGTPLVLTSDGTGVIAQDTYTENTDYSINLFFGEVCAKAEGKIAEGQTLLVTATHGAYSGARIEAEQLDTIRARLTLDAVDKTTGENVPMFIPMANFSSSSAIDWMTTKFQELDFEGSTILWENNTKTYYTELYETLL